MCGLGKKERLQWLYQWLNSAGTGQNGVPPPVSGVPLPETAVPPPKFVVPPPGDAVLYFGQLIFGKIITIVVTRDQILRLKCTKFYFGWGSGERTAARGSVQRSPRPLAGFKGPTSKGRDDRGGKRKGAEGKEGKGRRGERKEREEM